MIPISSYRMTQDLPRLQGRTAGVSTLEAGMWNADAALLSNLCVTLASAGDVETPALWALLSRRCRSAPLPDSMQAFIGPRTVFDVFCRYSCTLWPGNDVPMTGRRSPLKPMALIRLASLKPRRKRERSSGTADTQHQRSLSTVTLTFSTDPARGKRCSPFPFFFSLSK